MLEGVMKKKSKSTIHIDSRLHERLKSQSGSLDVVFYKFVEKILSKEADKLASKAGFIKTSNEN